MRKQLRRLGRSVIRFVINTRLVVTVRSILREDEILQLRKELKACGERVHFQAPVTITGPSHVEIGCDVAFAAYVHIWGDGGVRIGNRVMIGTHTSISSITHDHNQNIMYDTVILKPVTIEDDVWISSNSVILPGVTIGKGAVIGAGAVVNRDVPPLHVVAGVPARTIKTRSVPVQISRPLPERMGSVECLSTFS
jgi:acetyltransferase-like isoleucine patch superfamily enzyme